jgi:hypothetical protein
VFISGIVYLPVSKKECPRLKMDVSIFLYTVNFIIRGDRDRMEVGFITTYAIGA